MFDKLVSLGYMVIVGIALLGAVSVWGYKTYQNVEIYRTRTQIEAQKAACDCIAQEMYFESKRGGI